MATASSAHGNEGRSSCPICLGDFKLPRQLWCMHTFCQGCLQDFINSKVVQVNKLTEFACPICRNVTRPSAEDTPTSVWATLFPLNTIVQAMSGNTTVKVDQPCQACNTRGTSSPAVGFCVVCREVMCETCEGVHRVQKISRNHTIITMEEFTSNPQTVMKFAEGFNCPEHAGKEVEFYCKDHKIACCGTCCVVRHRNCPNVSELKKELSNLLLGMNIDSVIDQMKKLEIHLERFTEVNESNISLLESQVNDLTTQIRGLRKKLNDAFDELEAKVKIEGNRIYKEEMIRKQEENHECQSLISAIRNSHTFLETLKKYGSDTQVFLTLEKMTSHLTSYRDQIRGKYRKTQTLTVQLEFDPELLSLSSREGGMLGKCVEMKQEKIFNLQDISVSLRDYSVAKVETIELKFHHGINPFYTNVSCIANGQVMLADRNNKRVCLLDLSYNLITSYTTPDDPWDICMVNDDEVALLYKDRVQFLSGRALRDGEIRPTREITNRNFCFGIAATRNGDLLVSGYYGKNQFYWSRISPVGEEKFYHQFGAWSRYAVTNIALDSSDTRVYISLYGPNTLFCFNIDGSKTFLYSPENLRRPRGIALDIDDNVYVVGQKSRNIHQLLPDGAVIRIISTDVPDNPIGICFLRDNYGFYITSKNSKRLSLFRLGREEYESVNVIPIAEKSSRD